MDRSSYKVVRFMCGIGGLISTHPFNTEEAEMARDLMAFLVRRGRDAWGFFDGESVTKNPGNFLESNMYVDLPNLLVGKTLFLCHTRYATVGNPKENKNNHPFELGPFVMAHNGVIFYWEEFEDPYDIETDSFSLLWWIKQEYDIHGDTVLAIKRGIDHIVGTFAVWLYNREDDATYLFRTHEQPLNTFVNIRIFPYRIMFASDVDSIAYALRIPKEAYVRLRMTTWRIKPYTIYRISEGRIKVAGAFSPKPYSRLLWDSFMEDFGHLTEYHRNDHLFSELEVIE